MTKANTPNSKGSQIPRPPIVVVMGHVDHGKTSLLDYLRKTNLAAREAGGITQATGAYEITVEHGDHKNKRITFIDTPGHEAFSRMRARGASIADFAILVVAADEGPKPQTKEAIKILQDTDTPYVVALTKIDKPNADEDRIKNMLITEGVMLEGMGGDISYQGVSVKTGQGIEELLNLILLLGEIEDLKCDLKAKARGFIIESHKDNRRGIVAHFILKDGTIREGDEIVTESAHGKIRTLEDFRGKRVKELTPSAPGGILGFEQLPKVGEEFLVGGDKPIIHRGAKQPQEKKAKDKNKLSVILKADTSGSLEVLRQVIEPVADITDASVGDVTSGDVKDAMNTESIILVFNSKIDKATESLAQIYKVTVISSAIIYDLVKQLDKFSKGEVGGESVGELEILKVFDKKGRAQVLGCKAITGIVYNGAAAKIFRARQEVGEGTIANLQSMKKNVEELKAGNECGILLDTNSQVEPGDIIRTF